MHFAMAAIGRDSLENTDYFYTYDTGEGEPDEDFNKKIIITKNIETLDKLYAASSKNTGFYKYMAMLMILMIVKNNQNDNQKTK